jgi:hypothetical protein
MYLVVCYSSMLVFLFGSFPKVNFKKVRLWAVPYIPLAATKGSQYLLLVDCNKR